MTLRQRYRLYAAEVEATQPWRWLGGKEAAEFVIARFLRSTYWRKHSTIRHCVLTYPAPGKMSGGVVDEGNVFNLGIIPESLYFQNLIHELTHPLIGVSKGDRPIDHEYDHRPKFAGALIESYRHWESAKTAEDLIKAFEKYGVKWEEFK